MNIENSYNSSQHGDTMLYLSITFIGFLQQDDAIFRHLRSLEILPASDALSIILKYLLLLSLSFYGKQIKR